jgi:hypothetical protein
MGRKRYFRMLLFNFQQNRSKGLRPTVFVPRTLVRTWGTRPELMTNGSITLPFVIPSVPGFPARGAREGSVCGFL